MMSSAFFFEARIIGIEPIIALCGLNEEQRFTVSSVQAANDLFRQNHPERVAEFFGL